MAGSLSRRRALGGERAGVVFVAKAGVAHWLPAIELAARASRHRVAFWSAMLVVGAALSAAIVIGVVYGGLVVAMLVVSARMGLGLVHFLYDRWVWRFSDQQVRATIGRDLFLPAGKGGAYVMR